MIRKQITALLCLLLFPVYAGAWDDMPLYVPKKPNVPTDVRKGASPDGAVSAGEAKEINGEFRSLLHMGQRKVAYERWTGKTYSDCRPETSAGSCDSCELIMGHASAVYYFYKDPVSGGCTLQQLDARIPVSDPEILAPLRRTGQLFFGFSPVRQEKSASTDPGWDGTGTGWKWQDDEDLAYLYMDTDQSTSSGNGVARFQWRRAPLYRRK